MMTPEERAKLAVAFDGYHIRLADVPSIESRVAAQIRDAVEEAARQAQAAVVDSSGPRGRCATPGDICGDPLEENRGAEGASRCDTR